MTELKQLYQHLKKNSLDRFAMMQPHLQLLANGVLANNLSKEACWEIYVHIHGMIGLAATFGYETIRDGARNIILALRPLMDAQSLLGDDDRQSLLFWIAELSDRLQQVQLAIEHDEAIVFTMPMSSGLEERVVWICSENRALIDRMEHELQKKMSSIAVFSSWKAMQLALSDGPPDAILVDGLLLGHAGKMPLGLLQPTINHSRIPVVVLAWQGDFVTRLEAVRLGGTHFCSPPHDYYQLIKLLTPWAYLRSHEAFRVLVLDDDELLCQWYAAILANGGMAVRSLTDPAQILDHLFAFRPELIVLDVHMSGCLGTEIALMLRQHKMFARVPILFVSSEDNLARELADLSRPGVEWLDTGFLSKPIPPSALIASVADRIERSRSIRNAEEGLRSALKEMENLQYALNQHAIVSAADVGGRILYVNDKFCEISGYSLSELIGKNHRMINSGYHSREFFQQMWETIASGRVWHGQIKNRRKGGGDYWVEATIVPFLNEKGKPYEYISIRTEITKQKNLEDQLRDMALFAEMNPVPVLRLDEQGHILLANPSAERILDIPREGKGSFLTLLSCNEPIDFGQLIRDNTSVQYEIRVGEHDVQFTLLGISELNAVHVYGANITELKKAQEGLAMAKEVAEKANRAKSEFLSSMSHELRTPMNAVLGFAQLLESDPFEPLTDSQKDSVSEITKAGDHLLELINEVLDLAKIETGKIELSIEEVDLAEVANECLSLVSSLTMSRHIVIYAESILKENTWILLADRTRLKQSLLNFLSNAIKYNREGGKVFLRCRAVGLDRFRVEVEDTGWGIAQEHLADVFQPFNRLGAEHSEVEGTGIGLVITKRLVEMMGGEIGVQSQLQVGSLFWMTLPGKSHDSLTMDHKIASLLFKKESTTIGQNITVLYVEDNPANLKLVQKLLKRRPEIKLLSAPSSSLGLDLAYANLPHIIILDIHLPGMSGFDMLSHLRAHPKTRNIPVIAVSANALPKDVQRGLNAGFAHYLTKPIQVDQFYAALDDVVKPFFSK